jgi:antitoxin MazE
MRVSEWGNSLAVRLPKDLVKALGLKAGDELDMVEASGSTLAVRKNTVREEALERMRNTRWELPPDYKFNRDEANGWDVD